jgi:hypothetical protein
MLQVPVDNTTSLWNSTKQRRNSLFISSESPSKLEIVTEASEIESFFIRTKNYFQSEAMQLQ